MAGAYPTTITTAMTHHDNNQLSHLFSALTALLDDNEYDDTFLKPTACAIEQVRTWLFQVDQAIPGILLGGHVSTDGSGGLRIEWLASNKEMRLVVPARQDEAAFIYYEDGSNVGVEPTVSADTLAKWLTWLCD